VKLSIRDLDLVRQRVFVRVDFNVPLKGGVIGDDTRIQATLPTIRYALDAGASVVVLASHLGRPKGKPNPEMSLRPVAARTSELLADAVPDEARSLLESALAVYRQLRATPHVNRVEARLADL